MFCSKCGKEIMDEAVVCPNCGCPTNNYSKASRSAEDITNGGLVLLSILIPLVGIILGIVNLSKNLKSSGTAYLLCGIISFVVSALIISAMG